MRQSHRISTLNGDAKDDGWGLFNLARARIAQGAEIIELTQGEHDIGTDARILEAMHASAMRGVTGYSPVPGLPKLREAVAKRLSERTGVATTPDHVQITPGGQAGLFAAHNATCDPGDRALYIDPYYATYPGTLRAVGAVPVAVEARSRHGFQPRAEAIAEKAEGAKSLLVNTPNNPTGAVYGIETLEGIARVTQDHDLWLISDEVYDTQVWEGEHISPRALPDMAERTLVVGSMSKSHAMTGSRLGWVVGPPEVIQNLTFLANATTYGVAGFVQEAGLHALSLGVDLEEEIAAPFRRRRAIVLRLVEGQNVVRAIPAQGAMYTMLDIRATGLSGEAFGRELLDQEAIAVMPGESFGHAAAGHIRLALTTDDARLEDAVARLLALAGRLADRNS
ncbi:MAG: pyridoxal phosphate-dependent aminotransferase [Alterinioella nitratireducens]|uniref:pyridoxal phosphate-dependent aminotransferase n=1 Tax=Alterinioella nitratireducens TaxID=2735915 RepID=UPI0040591A19